MTQKQPSDTQEKAVIAAEFVNPFHLKEWEQNPRFNDSAVEKVAASIKKFGFASPIIARKADKRVISGHTRLKAAKSLKLKQVPVRFLDLSEKDANALALADNRIAEIASWDDGLLGEILEELKDQEMDLDVIGFSAQELDQLLGEWEDPFYEDSMKGENEYDGKEKDDLIIEDNGQTIIYITVPVTLAQDATKLIGEILNEHDITHHFKVK